MKRLNLVALSLIMVFGLIACKEKKIVDGVKVSTEQVGADKIIRADFDFAFNEYQFPSAFWSLPSNSGTLEIAHIDGENKVILDANVSELLKLPTGDATLPNGTLIPLVIRGEGGIVQINIPDINARIYISHKNNETMVGFALSIKGLDGLSNDLGNSNIFKNFSFTGTKGVAGLFSGVEDGETGLAAFALFADQDNYGLVQSEGRFVRKPSRKLSLRKKKKLRRALRKLKRGHVGKELEI